MMDYIQVEKKTGQETFIGMQHSLQEFWAWAHSDIVSNAERGRLAEYIVKCSVQDFSPCRIEWDAVDVTTCEGIKVEVKSSAYLQTWKQTKLSNIQFDIAPKNAWDCKTNLYSPVKCRSADVYIFCLFAQKEATTANPLDLGQWEFYLLSSQVLDDQMPLQKSIGLKSLLKLGAIKSDFNQLHSTVKTLVSSLQ